MKEPAMRLMLATIELTATEAGYLLQAVDFSRLTSESLLEIIYQLVCKSEINQAAAYRMGLTAQVVEVVRD